MESVLLLRTRSLDPLGDSAHEAAIVPNLRPELFHTPGGCEIGTFSHPPGMGGV